MGKSLRMYNRAVFETIFRNYKLFVQLRNVHINCPTTIKREINLYVLAMIILFGEKEMGREGGKGRGREGRERHVLSV